jgi:carboxypeptidase T
MPYLNVRQVESALLVAARPPNHQFTELITLPNPTWEGRTCRALKIAKGGDSERVGVYFIGGVHAREWGHDRWAELAQESAACLQQQP